jgi:FemAB-related protein (PEP-CTERM system-associated)
MTGAALKAGRTSSPVIVHSAPDPRAWEAFVNRHPDATGYHHRGWTEVIARAFGHEPVLLAAENHEGIVGILPLVMFRTRLFGRFLVSMPFLNYGGVVADSAEVEHALLGAAVHEARTRGAARIELRHRRRAFSWLSCRQHKVAMTLTLEATPEAQWTAFDKRIRNQVRKAEKSACQIDIGGAELVDAFYDVFARNMRDLGTPVYSRRFFESILSVFPEHTRVFCVRREGQPVAASIVYWHRGICEVPWASSIREFNQFCPNTLLYWEMLRFSIQQGFRVFDFGRSTPGEGTYQFKAQWGAQPQPLVWEYWTAEGAELVDLNPKNPKFQRAIALWRRLPLPVTRAIGPYIVRNIP